MNESFYCPGIWATRRWSHSGKNFRNDLSTWELPNKIWLVLRLAWASAGKFPGVYSIATFVTLKTLEQVRNDICYQNLNVKIVGVGSGLTYSQYGATHHSQEDIGLMRLLPNMKVICPGDPVEVEAATRAMMADPQPCYLRIGSRCEPVLHEPPTDFQIRKGITLRPGKDIPL